MEKINVDETVSILINLEEIFEFKWGEYWYPLDCIYYEPKIAFDIHKFLKSKEKNIISDFCKNKYQTFYEILEIEINQSCFWKIDSKEFDFNWYSEKVVLFPDFSGMIYYSHEESITFAGHKILEFIQSLDTNWKSMEWTI